MPIEAKPGHPARYDCEYRRNGTANLFTRFAPLEGWRHVEVPDQRTAADLARVLGELSDTHLPNVPKIVLVQDNLNTHKPASLYEAFPAAHRAVSAMPSVKEMDGTPPRRAVRVALHSQTRKLAEYGGIGTQRPVVTMPRSANSRQGQADRRSRRMAV